jgi:hypothetical protein
MLCLPVCATPEEFYKEIQKSCLSFNNYLRVYIAITFSQTSSPEYMQQVFLLVLICNLQTDHHSNKNREIKKDLNKSYHDLLRMKIKRILQLKIIQ